MCALVVPTGESGPLHSCFVFNFQLSPPQALERDNHIDSQFDVGLDTAKEDDDEEIAQDVQNKKRKKKSSLKSLPQAKSFDQFVAEVCTFISPENTYANCVYSLQHCF